MTRPLFSIITVTYNAAALLPATLRSVCEQTCDDYEHIIVDGASSDGTVALARSVTTGRVRVHSQHDSGIYDAMNRGIGMSRGEYLIFLNAGDTFYDRKTLEAYAKAAHDNDMPGIIYGQTVLVDDAGDVVGQRHLKAPEQLTLNSFANGMVVCHQSMAVLKRIAPLYSMNYHYSADYEWAIRCLQHSRNNVYLDRNVTRYLNEGMTTRHHKASLKERFDIMCYYYGTLPTLRRHVNFLFRGMRRKVINPASKQ